MNAMQARDRFGGAAKRRGSQAQVWRLGVAAAAVLSGCSPAPGEAPSLGQTQQGICNGTELWNDSVVALKTTQHTNSSNPVPQSCTGLLISPTAVLTAQHCVNTPYKEDTAEKLPEGLDPSKWYTWGVGVGCHDTSTGAGCDWIPLAPEGIHLVDAPYPGPRYDVAVLQLAAPVAVPPTRLMNRARFAEVEPGDEVTNNGYGLLEPEGTVPSPVPLTDTVTVNDPGDGLDGDGMMVNDIYFTTYRSKPDVCVCHGDSGGPVLVNRDNEWFAVGIETLMWDGADPPPRDYATSVPYYFDWIADQVADLPAQSYLSSGQLAALL